MGIQEIERFEARDEHTSISCVYIDRCTFKQFIVNRVSLDVPVDQSMIEFNSLDELRDLRNVLNDMIASVEEGNFVGGDQ